MSPVYKLSANSVKNGRTVYGSMLAGNTAFTPPSWYESIATVTVGSGGSSQINFTSIPQTYAHLQVRATYKRTTATSSFSTTFIRLNEDEGSNYARHLMSGNGSTVGTEAGTNSNVGYAGIDTGVNNTNVFSVSVIDILDYANTNKYTTIRSLYGGDANGSGFVILASSLWMNTNAVTALRFIPSGDNFAQYTHFALYGIKVAS